jgi:hypothetical protein
VRAAGAEVGLADRGDARLGEHLVLEVQELQSFPELTSQGRSHAQLLEALPDGARHHRRRVLVVRGQEPGARRLAAPAAPLAAVVELADHARRATAFLPVVELFLDLVLDQLALLLDHQDLFQALGEALGALRLERPRHGDLIDAQADVARDFARDAEIGQGLHGVAERLAGRDDAQSRPGRIENDLVELVGSRVGERRVDLPVEDARFLLEDAVGPADVQAARRKREIGGEPGNHSIQVDLHGSARFDHVGDALERDPAAGVAAHRDAVQAEVEIVLHAGRVEHRDQAGLEDVLRLVRQGRGLGGVVVAREHQHAAVLGGAGGVGVLEHVAAAIDAGALAVPHGEHAVVLRAVEQVDLLRAPDGGRRQVLVHARLELDVVALEVLGRAPQRLVEAAERRAAVAGDEAGGVQAGARVAQALQHHQADQRLRAGQKDPAGVEGVLVF